MSQLNPLNDLSKVYLDQVAKINRQDEANDIKRWEEGEQQLQQQMETSSKELATLGAPQMEEETSYVEAYVKELNKIGSPMKEEKKAAKDYDGDGKIESGKDEYFGSKDKAIKKAMKKEEVELDEAERSISDRLDRKNKLMKKTTRKAMDFARREGEASGHARFNMGRLGRERDKLVAKLNKEGRFSDWRHDLIEIADDIPLTDTEASKIVKEKKVNNKVTINPKMSEAVAQIGGEVISETEVELQEKQKDTPDQVKAVIAFDRARKGTDDATYDSMHGKKKQAKKERDYAKWQRDKGAEDAQKSGHRWKHAKGSTREKEGKKSETHAYIKDSYAAEGVLGKEVKELQKAGKTLKDTPVVNADKTANPNYKGEKFGVKKAPASQVAAVEEKDWIQKAVKRPGAFTRKAKAAGQSVQQFAKTVDDNPGKYSTRTKRQANLAQTFASMKKEDVEELFYTLIAD